jgi:hypothetical protein
MIKVKTFGEPLEAFKTQRELTQLDQRVNEFIRENGVARVISVSDSTTSENGSTIGLIRVLVYEDAS